MYDENVTLCASSGYEKKYYLNDAFQNLPQSIKDELKIMCVLFTEEVSCILSLNYDSEGNLHFNVRVAEDDLMFDDISCDLKIKQMQTEKRELLQSLEMYYKVFALGDEGAWE